jgi:predicted RNA-binding protein with PUA-like domain
MPAYWLFKSEPGTFSWDDLLASPRRRTFWDGVRNYQARNLLRDEMKKGDGVLFYHSSTAIPAVVGVASIVKAGSPDPTQFDGRSKYHDPKSTPEEPRWFGVEIQARRALPEPVPLARLRETRGLESMKLLQRGMRLSVQPVTRKEWEIVLRLGGLDPRKALGT